MTVKKLGLIGNPEKPEIGAAIGEIVEFAAGHGVGVVVSTNLGSVAADGVTVLETDRLVREVDVVIALGGDGTMLRAARRIGEERTPLMGVNLGSLGYLTDVPLDGLQQALAQLASGDYHLEDRVRVETAIWRDGERVDVFSALNDVVVNMGAQSRALDLEVIMEGVSLGSFLGDGLIVSTPTGSTAYNLSAGGPICHSGVSCLVITPICPHSLAIRPLVVPRGEGVELLLHYAGQGAAITADGQQYGTLETRDRLTFDLRPKQVRLVKFPQSNFYAVMRSKLNWGAPKRRAKGNGDAG